MKPAWWYAVGASLYLFGAIMGGAAFIREPHDDAPAFARKIPHPPECPDCGLGAKLTKAE